MTIFTPTGYLPFRIDEKGWVSDYWTGRNLGLVKAVLHEGRPGWAAIPMKFISHTNPWRWGKAKIFPNKEWAGAALTYIPISNPNEDPRPCD